MASTRTVKTVVAKTPLREINLYWVADHEGSEDWFIFARTPLEARRYHRDYEGFNTVRGITADCMIANVSLKRLETAKIPRHAQLPDLKELGMEVVHPDPNHRAVRYQGETFVEGYLQSEIVHARDNQSETMGRGRPYGTRRQIFLN